MSSEPQLQKVPDSSANQQMSKGMPALTGGELELRLQITDADLIAEFRGWEDLHARDEFAKKALKLGVTALRLISSQLDVERIQDASSQLVERIHTVLDERSKDLTSGVATELTRYFDPETGLVSQRLSALVRADGELERVIRSQVDEENSVLARTLAAQIGNDSPLFRLLTPTEADSLQSQVQRVLQVELDKQSKAVFDQFSLDKSDSALSRLIAQLEEKTGGFTDSIDKRLKTVVSEFSLDNKESALNRLVTRVSEAQEAITQQFSKDNESSAINKILGMLSLDSENSALSLVKRELSQSIKELDEKNASFHQEVRDTLQQFAVRKKVEKESTLHGGTFQDGLSAVICRLAQEQGDIFEFCGNSVGVIKNCKKGDNTVELGPESAAPGARIVWEAKEDKSYGLEAALTEVEEARHNRSAQVGVFVYSKSIAREDISTFKRYGKNIVIVWDMEDPTSDIMISAAYSVAKALCVQAKEGVEEIADEIQEIDQAVRMIEKTAKLCSDILTAASNVKRDGARIHDSAEKLRDGIGKYIGQLDQALEALKLAQP